VQQKEAARTTARCRHETSLNPERLELYQLSKDPGTKRRKPPPKSAERRPAVLAFACQPSSRTAYPYRQPDLERLEQLQAVRATGKIHAPSFSGKKASNSTNRKANLFSKTRDAMKGFGSSNVETLYDQVNSHSKWHIRSLHSFGSCDTAGKSELSLLHDTLPEPKHRNSKPSTSLTTEEIHQGRRRQRLCLVKGICAAVYHQSR
jgi:hypothetical protein